MLKKRTRSVHQDQPKTSSFVSVSDFILRNDFRNQKARKNSVFNLPGLFVGLSRLFEGDAAKTPTSTLDHRVLSSEGCPFRDKKCWDCGKVGLSIIDDTGGLDESRTKNIIFGPQLRIKLSTSGYSFDDYIASMSLPKNYPVFRRSKVKYPDIEARSSRCIFEIGDEATDPTEPQLVEVFQSCSLDSSGRRFIHMPKNVRKSNLGLSLVDQKFCSRNEANSQFQPAPVEGGLKPGSVSQFCSDPDRDASGIISSADIELSEDYTYVLMHGPNPKTTHIYSDCILGCHCKNPYTSGNEHCDYVLHPSMKYLDIPALFPSKEFLSACYNCRKNLDGSDIFMYRGEKAFCSLECRESEIVNNEDSDETESASSENPLGNKDQP